jgi:hypothetical protein
MCPGHAIPDGLVRVDAFDIARFSDRPSPVFGLGASLGDQ